MIEAACHSVIIEDGKATGVRLEDGRIIEAKTVILTTGTYMTSTILRVIPQQAVDRKINLQ